MKILVILSLFFACASAMASGDVSLYNYQYTKEGKSAPGLSLKINEPIAFGLGVGLAYDSLTRFYRDNDFALADKWIGATRHGLEIGISKFKLGVGYQAEYDKVYDLRGSIYTKLSYEVWQ